MNREKQIRDYLHRADEAEVWAAAVEDPFVRSQWQNMARDYRQLALARPGMSIDALSEQPSPLQAAEAKRE